MVGHLYLWEAGSGSALGIYLLCANTVPRQVLSSGFGPSAKLPLTTFYLSSVRGLICSLTTQCALSTEPIYELPIYSVYGVLPENLKKARNSTGLSIRAVRTGLNDFPLVNRTNCSENKTIP